jgi:hypothetical protein
MGIKDLNKLYYIKKNIRELEEELEELNNLGAAPITDSIKGNNVSNPTEQYVIKRNRILEKLNKVRHEYLEEYEKISDFINDIEDEEIKLIARLRFIKQKDWVYIAEEISPEDETRDRTTPRKKINRYLRNLEEKNERKSY